MQKGSLVAPDRLRFDISHPKPLTPDEIAVIEADVNREVRENSEVETHLMDAESAVAAGAMALFGEKYGDEVRVVTMGRRDTRRPGLLQRALRRHPRPAHRRHQPVQDRLRDRAGGGRAAHRGGDRRGGARSISPSRSGP